jgi:DNA adenine methylase
MSKSIIPYIGGKGAELTQKIIDNFPEEFSIYVECFGGSGAVLLNKEKSDIEVYNDLESNVYSLFKVMQDEELFKQFKLKCDVTYYSREINEEFREDLKKNDLSILDRAYKFFIVNRTSFNGNGKSFSGKSTTPRRKMANVVSRFLSSIDNLEDFHQRLSSTIVEHKDALQLIQDWDKPNSFQYLDPPYSSETRSADLYKVEMNDEQQKKFVDILLNIKHSKVLVSGYHNDEYKRLEDAGWKVIEIPVQVRIKSKEEGKTSRTAIEVLWKNY